MNDQKKVIIKSVIIIGLVAYFLFLTYRAVAFNYNTNKKINSLQQEIALIDAEKQYLENLNVYYNTDTYKELEARRKLGLKKAGETVIAIPIDPKRLAQIENREVPQQIIDAAKKDTPQTDMSNARKWLNYILRI